MRTTPVPPPDDDRCDPETRAGGVVVEEPKHTVGTALERNLFVELAQRGPGRIFAFVDAPARKGPLSAVVSKAGGSARDHERSFPLFV